MWLKKTKIELAILYKNEECNLEFDFIPTELQKRQLNINHYTMPLVHLVLQTSARSYAGIRRNTDQTSVIACSSSCARRLSVCGNLSRISQVQGLQCEVIRVDDSSQHGPSMS